MESFSVMYDEEMFPIFLSELFLCFEKRKGFRTFSAKVSAQMIDVKDFSQAFLSMCWKRKILNITICVSGLAKMFHVNELVDKTNQNSFWFAQMSQHFIIKKFYPLYIIIINHCNCEEPRGL
jgi:hypothetical protein